MESFVAQGQFITLRSKSQRPKVRPLEEPHSMSLVFALLQKDFIVFAADNRHTRGDREGSYKNDHGIKTVEILDGRGILGFAGQDFGEQIVARCTSNGLVREQSLFLQIFNG
jgi:20S proteasome alpha/beta subunit